MEVGEHELGTGETATGNKDGGQNFKGTFEAAHNHAQPEGHDEGQEGQLAADNGADGVRGETGDLAGNEDRHTDGAEGHGGCIGYKADTGSVQRLEAKAHQHGSGDGHGRTETGCAFDEGTEGKGDKDSLQTAVICESGQGLFDIFKLA